MHQQVDVNLSPNASTLIRMTKNFLIEIGDERIPVTQSQNKLSISGREADASLVELGPKLYSLLLRNSSHVIHIANQTDTSITLTVNGKSLVANFVSERSELITRHGQQKTVQKTTNELRAPMLGLATQVLVNPGDSVVPGQGLIVLEAMKMENELRSPIEGRIRQVYVQEGESVTVNAILVEFES